jgi:hypothetical protein
MSIPMVAIIGILTFETLHLLNQEIKSNAILVHSNLGGGQHGHLGLVISPTACTLLSNTPYARPGLPDALDIPANATKHAQDLLDRTYEENLRVFLEVRGMERALTQQIVGAINPQYIVAMRNRSTRQFTGIVYQLLQYLLTVYGQITPSQLLELEHETENICL